MSCIAHGFVSSHASSGTRKVVMPMSGLLLISVLLFNNLVVEVGFATQPSWAEIVEWKGFLMLNIVNAFGLNVAIAVFLKYLSPVTYILVGNIKDIVVAPRIHVFFFFGDGARRH